MRDGKKSPLRVAVAGLGTVGVGTIEILTRNRALISARAGRDIDIVAVSARDPGRDRGIDFSGMRWFSDAVAMAAAPDIDVVAELIGGSDGVALAVVETAIRHGRSVVTANKALLAHHADPLTRLARQHGAALAIEASVAGGIPIMKGLGGGLAANRFERVCGILNGTCNYILTQMRETGRDFAGVLAEAQALGYAEADPTLDIDGHDTAHKLALLAAVAFDMPVDLASVHVEGIRAISPLDIQYAEDLGYRIKLLGTAHRTPRGIEQRVHPTMVAKSNPLAHVDGVDNAVVVTGDAVGRVMFQGRGAGAGPTGSAVVADLIDLASGQAKQWFARTVDGLSAVSIAEHAGACYVRLMVRDEPGVLADMAAELRNERVSVEAMRQPRHALERVVPIVFTTHPSQEAALQRALGRIATLPSMVEPPQMIRIDA